MLFNEHKFPYVSLFPKEAAQLAPSNSEGPSSPLVLISNEHINSNPIFFGSGSHHSNSDATVSDRGSSNSSTSSPTISTFDSPRNSDPAFSGLARNSGSLSAVPLPSNHVSNSVASTDACLVQSRFEEHTKL